jgi:hypothetical protein
MSEETQDNNDGTWSGLKKTIIGTLTTVIAGGGVWVSTLIFGGHEEPKEETKTEQAAPAAQPAININVDNSSKNNAGGGTNTIIKEKTTVVEKPVPAKEDKKKSETEDSPW